MSAATKLDSDRLPARAVPGAAAAEAPWPKVPPLIPRLLRTLCAERDAAEVDATARHDARVKAAEAEFAEQSAAIQTKYQSDKQRIESRAEQAVHSAQSGREAKLREIRDAAEKGRKTLLTQ